ncbi:hypothetical protein PENTCL1PPCAC_9794, partial [Pristionchus entomophagus]
MANLRDFSSDEVSSDDESLFECIDIDATDSNEFKSDDENGKPVAPAPWEGGIMYPSSYDSTVKEEFLQQLLEQDKRRRNVAATPTHERDQATLEVSRTPEEFKERCEYCDFIFLGEETLDLHVQMKHPELVPTVNPVAPTVTAAPTIEQESREVPTKREPFKPLKCERCNRVFYGQVYWDRHVPSCRPVTSSEDKEKEPCNCGIKLEGEEKLKQIARNLERELEIIDDIHKDELIKQTHEANDKLGELERMLMEKERSHTNDILSFAKSSGIDHSYMEALLNEKESIIKQRDEHIAGLEDDLTLIDNEFKARLDSKDEEFETRINEIKWFHYDEISKKTNDIEEQRRMIEEKQNQI